jgi:hypothetical protein
MELLPPMELPPAEDIAPPFPTAPPEELLPPMDIEPPEPVARTIGIPPEPGCVYTGPLDEVFDETPPAAFEPPLPTARTPPLVPGSMEPEVALLPLAPQPSNPSAVPTTRRR